MSSNISEFSAPTPVTASMAMMAMSETRIPHSMRLAPSSSENIRRNVRNLPPKVAVQLLPQFA